MPVVIVEKSFETILKSLQRYPDKVQRTMSKVPSGNSLAEGETQETKTDDRPAKSRRVPAPAIVSLVISLVILIPYTLQAYNVSRGIIRYGPESRPYWRSGPAGSLFPVPCPPGMLEVLSPVTDLGDLVIYVLIETNLLPVVMALIAILCFLAGFAVSLIM